MSVLLTWSSYLNTSAEEMMKPDPSVPLDLLAPWYLKLDSWQQEACIFRACSCTDAPPAAREWWPRKLCQAQDGLLCPQSPHDEADTGCNVLVSLEGSGNVAFLWVSSPSCCSGSSSTTVVAPFSPLLPRGCSRVGGMVMLDGGVDHCALMSLWLLVFVRSLWLQRWVRNCPVKSQDIMARSESLQLFWFWHCHYGIMGILGWWQLLAKQQGVKSPLCAWQSCFAIISNFFSEADFGSIWKRIFSNHAQ